MSNFKHKYGTVQQAIFNLILPKTIAVAALTILPSLAVQAVGFSILDVPDAGHKNLTVGVWYPSDAEVPTSPNSPFNQALAEDAKINVESAPLVVLSHGFGGWMGGHADTALALAEAGFVVAAPSHTGNTFKDMTSTIDQWLIDRPRHIGVAVDYLKSEWDQHSVIDNSKVGVFGFSAGGHTALSLIGAVPNFELAKAHCESNPKEYVCREGMIQGALDADMQSLPASSWGADSQIDAAVIAAPGLGFAYDKQSLQNVQVPVQLWSGLADNRVPHQSNAQTIADALGELSENHWVEDASHFSFMIQSCTAKLKEFEPETWDFLCVDKEGFDRKAFHTQMNADIVNFFKAHLSM